jgi:hypothetical protein
LRVVRVEPDLARLAALDAQSPFARMQGARARTFASHRPPNALRRAFSRAAAGKREEA